MNIIHCQNCGTKVEKHTDTEYECPACGQFFWNNPAAAVAVVLLNGDQILVSKRAFEPNQGKYDLPGGFLEYAEDPRDGARRELQEEAAIELGALELLTAYSGLYTPDDSVCDLVFIAKSWQGEPIAHDDSAELVWKPLSFLDEPEFSPPYGGLRQLLEAYLAGPPSVKTSAYSEATAINEVIEAAQTIVIIQADNPDGDSLASALALEHILGDLGKTPLLYCAVDMPPYLRHMPGWDRVSNQLPSNFDATVIVDTSADSLLELLNTSGQKHQVTAKPSIVLDHHATEATITWATVLCNQLVVATGELIYELACQLNWPLNAEANNLLAISIMSDSLGLTTSATSARSIQVIAELVAAGVNIPELENRRRDLQRKSPDIVKYKGELLQRISYDDSGRVASVYIPWREIEMYSPHYNPSMLVIDEMRMTEGVAVAIAFKIYKDGKITAKLRCNHGFPVAKDIAEHFGGGGHVYASGFKIQTPRPLIDVKAECLTLANQLLDNLK